jgi:hypothetical protein
VLGSLFSREQSVADQAFTHAMRDDKDLADLFVERTVH